MFRLKKAFITKTKTSAKNNEYNNAGRPTESKQYVSWFINACVVYLQANSPTHSPHAGKAAWLYLDIITENCLAQIAY